MMGVPIVALATFLFRVLTLAPSAILCLLALTGVLVASYEGLLWLSAVLIGAAQLSWLFWLGIGLAALSGLSLRQTSRWQRGLLVGDGQAPRNQRI